MTSRRELQNNLSKTKSKLLFRKNWKLIVNLSGFNKVLPKSNHLRYLGKYSLPYTLIGTSTTTPPGIFKLRTTTSTTEFRWLTTKYLNMNKKCQVINNCTPQIKSKTNKLSDNLMKVMKKKVSGRVNFVLMKTSLLEKVISPIKIAMWSSKILIKRKLKISRAKTQVILFNLIKN